MYLEYCIGVGLLIAFAALLLYLVKHLVQSLDDVYELLDAQSIRHASGLFELANVLKAMERDYKAEAVHISRQDDLILIEFLAPIKARKNSFVAKSVLMREQDAAQLSESLKDFLAPKGTIN